MPKFVIERDVPGAGGMNAAEREAAARESNAARNELGASDLQWVTSYIAADRIYCVYIARDEDIVMEHARCLDIPANRISRVEFTMDPTTAENSALSS